MSSVEVVSVKLEALCDKLDERHEALMRHISMRDDALKATLEQINGTLPPLVKRVEELEKVRTQLVALVAGASALMPILFWVAERLI
jgi:hypothetical protein